MHAAGRLGLYAAGLVVAFAGAFGVAAAVVPPQVAENEGDTQMDHSAMDASSEHTSLPGLSLSADEHMLSPVTAPARVGEAGELSFRILSLAGEPLTTYAESHEKELHLIVVRSDGAEFRHVHPELDPDSGTWSLPWEWEAAGTYRVYADFTPGGADAEGVTLTRTVYVAGDYAPAPSEPSRVSTTGEFTATLEGDLVTGSVGELTISIQRGEEPVTSLQPYLGAFGHLVALRDGDLAYLHVHPDADEPRLGETSGPSISFLAEAPTPGRYLLYLDFQVDGQVHTARFVVDATAGEETSTEHDGTSHGH